MDDETEVEPSIDDLEHQAYLAIQALVTATYGPMAVRKWMCYAETVDDEDNIPMLMLVNSKFLPPWDLQGMAHFGSHLVHDITEEC